MSTLIQKVVAEDILGSIDIPATAYEKAIARYADLGDWFGRDEGNCTKFEPYIYAQGSFRLGTVIRPLDAKASYDLDVGCRLRKDVTKMTHTQFALKDLVRTDLEAYRQARKIDNQLDERDRCWRLEYADALSFHMDVVPSLPEDNDRRQLLLESMRRYGVAEPLAQTVASHLGSITDRKHPGYNRLSRDWVNSNSEGYAFWFEYRMRLANRIEKRALLEAKAADVQPLPARHWNSPLQQCIKILKRHRDLKFRQNRDSRPASIIITTLAATAYEGEDDIQPAMVTILSRMRKLVKAERPRVVNPINPDEDFADKWATTEGIRLRLEDHFWSWLSAAESDFAALGSSNDPDYLTEQSLKNYGVELQARDVGRRLEILGVPIAARKTGMISETPKNPVDLRGGGRHG